MKEEIWISQIIYFWNDQRSTRIVREACKELKRMNVSEESFNAYVDKLSGEQQHTSKLEELDEIKDYYKKFKL